MAKNLMPIPARSIPAPEGREDAIHDLLRGLTWMTAHVHHMLPEIVEIADGDPRLVKLAAQQIRNEYVRLRTAERLLRETALAMDGAR